MENTVTSHIVKGAILSLISIVLSVIVSVFNLYEMSWLSLINYAIFLGGLIYGAILYANQNNNNVTYGNVFAHGFKTASIVIVFTSIYTIVAIKFLFPEMIDITSEIQRKQLSENPKMTDEMIEQSLDFVKKFYLPLTLGGIIIINGLLGAIGAAIGAGVAKKNPNPFENNAA